MADTETQFCNNCKKQISVNNFMMHEVHCKRHISLCEHCQEPIPNGEMTVHFEENHANIACPRCGVEVEKMYLEDHEENSCQKKPMDCVFCELKFPKNEFEAHTEYCGSRTEPCLKCGQYIKLKDQTKHEDSKCRYPEVKPTNRNRHEQTAPPNGHNNDYATGMNSFALEELSRVLNVRGGARNQHRPEHQVSPPVVQAASRTSLDRAKARQNVTVKRVNKTNQKPDVNRQRGQKAMAISPEENDYDHLLAMHLAKDLNPDEDLDVLMRAYEKPKAPLVPAFPEEHMGQNRNTFSEDMVMIPCEFCGEPFISDDLVQHQSGCSLDRISDVLPTLISANNRTDAANNIRGGGGGERSPVVDPPAIINNLRNFEAEPWLDDTAMYPEQNGDDDLLLPCEFCDELYPMDSLVQHQALCDSNTTMTPRVMTPAEPTIHRPKPKKRTPGLESDFPNLSSMRHQPPPGLLADEDEDSDNETNIRPKKYTLGATHRVRKPNTSAASNVPDTSPTSVNSRKVMKKYGADSFDRGDNYSKQGGYSRQSANNDTDSWLQSNSQVYKYRPSGGAARTKDALNSLLDDSGHSSSHDLLGHIGASRKPQRSDATPVTRKVAGSHAAGVPGRVPAKTRTTANVQRDNRNTPLSNSTSQPRNRNSHPNFEVRVRPAEADEPSTMLSNQRRSRANHVFGASTSTRTSKK